MMFLRNVDGGLTSRAIKLIVGGFTRLDERQYLEDRPTQSPRLRIDLKARTGFDHKKTIAQLYQDILTIELSALSGAI